MSVVSCTEAVCVFKSVNLRSFSKADTKICLATY